MPNTPTLLPRAGRERNPHRGRLRGARRYAPTVLGDRPETRTRKADTVDFPLEHDTGHLVDAASDLLAKTLNIGRRGASGINQEVGVLLRDHRAASHQAAAPGGINQA